MENNFKYIVYLTVNNINKKLYIGVHKLDRNKEFDGYIGCGLNKSKPSTLDNPKTNFQFAVKKYGWDVFTRYSIAEFDTEEDALLLERTIVNERFVNRTDTYNMTIGGERSPFDNNKAINQFDLQGNLLNSYESLIEAATANKLWAENIGIAARKKVSYNKFFWSEEDHIDISEYSYIYLDKLIYVYDSTGNFLRTYSSVSEAAKEYDITRESMRDHIYKGTKYHNKYFSYTSPDAFTLKVDPLTKVYKYSMSGEFIESNTLQYFSDLYNIDILKLYKVANTKLCINLFQWNLENPLKMNNKENIENLGVAKKVGQYTLDGLLVKIYNTVTECKKDFSNVGKVLKGVLTKTKGYTFKYILES